MSAAVESIRDYHHGPDAGINPANCDYAVVADFDDQAGYLGYRDHPAHREFVKTYVEPDRGQPGGGPVRAVTAAQKASSGSSMRSRVVASAISRSTARRGSTVCAKNRAVASLPW